MNSLKPVHFLASNRYKRMITLNPDSYRSLLTCKSLKLESMKVEVDGCTKLCYTSLDLKVLVSVGISGEWCASMSIGGVDVCIPGYIGSGHFLVCESDDIGYVGKVLRSGEITESDLLGMVSDNAGKSESKFWTGGREVKCGPVVIKECYEHGDVDITIFGRHFVLVDDVEFDRLSHSSTQDVARKVITVALSR